ncbi:MAG: hypothetical protein IJ587_10905 [Synergistaceae bacterium]|nr:hypothetical protein [Synergistaceae bacterium]
MGADIRLDINPLRQTVVKRRLLLRAPYDGYNVLRVVLHSGQHVLHIQQVQARIRLALIADFLDLHHPQVRPIIPRALHGICSHVQPLDVGHFKIAPFQREQQHIVERRKHLLLFLLR